MPARVNLTGCVSSLGRCSWLGLSSDFRWAFHGKVGVICYSWLTSLMPTPGVLEVLQIAGQGRDLGNRARQVLEPARGFVRRFRRLSAAEPAS